MKTWHGNVQQDWPYPAASPLCAGIMHNSYHCAVRGLGGSLLLRGDRMNDFAETRDRLERTAAGGPPPKTLWSASIVCTLRQSLLVGIALPPKSSKHAHLAGGRTCLLMALAPVQSFMAQGVQQACGAGSQSCRALAPLRTRHCIRPVLLAVRVTGRP